MAEHHHHHEDLREPLQYPPSTGAPPQYGAVYQHEVPSAPGPSVNLGELPRQYPVPSAPPVNPQWTANRLARATSHGVTMYLLDELLLPLIVILAMFQNDGLARYAEKYPDADDWFTRDRVSMMSDILNGLVIVWVLVHAYRAVVTFWRITGDFGVAVVSTGAVPVGAYKEFRSSGLLWVYYLLRLVALCCTIGGGVLFIQADHFFDAAGLIIFGGGGVDTVACWVYGKTVTKLYAKCRQQEPPDVVGAAIQVRLYQIGALCVAVGLAGLGYGYYQFSSDKQSGNASENLHRTPGFVGILGVAIAVRIVGSTPLFRANSVMEDLVEQSVPGSHINSAGMWYGYHLRVDAVDTAQQFALAAVLAACAILVALGADVAKLPSMAYGAVMAIAIKTYSWAYSRTRRRVLNRMVPTTTEYNIGSVPSASL